MNKNNSVDILLPYWGDFNLLKQTVESVINQSYKNWKLFIFDDCYPDKSAKITYSNHPDNRIKYFRHKQNIGITKNFNFALEKASSKYCILLGCDDILLSNYLERALSQIKNSDFYHPRVVVIDANNKRYLPLPDKIKKIIRPKKSGLYNGEKLAASLCIGNWLYFPSILWKTSTIKKYGFNDKYKIVEDLILEIQIVMNGGILYLDNEETFLYRRFKDSLSSKESSSKGIRFKEESEAYSFLSTELGNMNWQIASLLAKIRLTSRFNQLLSKIKFKLYG